MAYSDKLINHFENPQNVGSLDKNSIDVGTGLVGAPACGDVMKLQLKISNDGVIEEAKFTPIKSLPSFGPTLPLSKPRNLLEGINSLSVSLISSPVIELALST